MNIFAKLCTCGFWNGLGFVHVYSFMHPAWYFDHEMMMLNWMELKFCMHKIETLMDILALSL